MSGKNKTEKEMYSALEIALETVQSMIQDEGEIGANFYLNDYVEFTRDMWFGPNPDTRTKQDDLFMAALGLSGETGEVMEYLKKEFRDGTVNPEKLKKELGDVFFYWCRIADMYGFTPVEIIEANVTKLKDREERGVKRGSGDER